MENLPLFLKYWAIERSKPDGGIWNGHGNWHGKAIVSSDRPMCQDRSASKIKSHSNKPTRHCLARAKNSKAEGF